MKVLLGILVVTLALATLDINSVQALTCMYSTFESQIERAELIFVGTVTNDTCVWIPCSMDGTDTCAIATRYRFDRVTYLKGEGPSDSLMLAQMGGTIGNILLSSDGSVDFEPGLRYVVLAVDSKRLANHYTASPCWMGPFGIWPDSASAGPVVHLGRNPLITFDGTHLVGLHSRPWSPDYGIWEVDANGDRHPPSLRPLPEAIRASDADLRSKMEREGRPRDRIEEVLAQVRTVWLSPHQDPGNRVTEEEFLNALASVIKRVEAAAQTK